MGERRRQWNPIDGIHLTERYLNVGISRSELCRRVRIEWREIDCTEEGERIQWFR